MSKREVGNNVIYNGKRRVQDLDTGEIFEVDEVIKKTPRNDFMITYLSAIIKLIDSLGNKKMQVIKYILTNMDKSMNTLIITNRELAEKSNVSVQTVVDTLKTLEQAQIITRRTGAIMIHPNLIYRDSDFKEKYLLTRFKDFDNNTSPLNKGY